MYSETFPFMVLPSIDKNLRCEFKKHNVVIGDVVAVYSEKYNKLVFAIYADNGPADKLGEGSLSLGWELRGTPDNEKTDASSAVVTGDVRYLLFPASAAGAPYSFESIQNSGKEHLEEWADWTLFWSCKTELWEACCRDPFAGVLLLAEFQPTLNIGNNFTSGTFPPC